mmetsp:Transcript_7582/g.25681  ORF Transcript_7582/g.25681 Transcript_7582/m.25681 type:complete len:217 (+) Transcript_7582:269-919(+)
MTPARLPGRARGTRSWCPLRTPRPRDLLRAEAAHPKRACRSRSNTLPTRTSSPRSLSTTQPEAGPWVMGAASVDSAPRSSRARAVKRRRGSEQVAAEMEHHAAWLPTWTATFRAAWLAPRSRPASFASKHRGCGRRRPMRGSAAQVPQHRLPCCHRTSRHRGTRRQWAPRRLCTQRDRVECLGGRPERPRDSGTCRSNSTPLSAQGRIGGFRKPSP